MKTKETGADDKKSMPFDSIDPTEPFNLKDPKELFEKLYQKAIKLGLKGEDFEKLDALQEIINSCDKEEILFIKYFKAVVGTFAVFVVCILFVYCAEWPVSNARVLSLWFDFYGADVEKEPCIINLPEAIVDVFRPPVDCAICRGITAVDRVSNITSEEFENKYAYSGHPVIITDGTESWTAPEVFSFEFFKEIYTDDSPVMENTEANCQFFPYKTNFKNLRDVFTMSEERAHMKDGSDPWYIGWSNCDFLAANILREHYKRPYFLPVTSESSRTDWIFMGSPGYGAHMHIDNVGHPSWQAQITGTKQWTLEPPPECYFECPARIQATVYPGEIIVLDTNSWFHATLNVGNDISITIGSEYD
ncbi:hypothetical protein ACJMK2_009109 [Sinanodonta woodiana]|uniref:Cupin-like domain-containing protein n=1 Tax=Sinanodonta woodiana TaxID=1069815 RepID=A0ABD3VB92_SINWO